MAKQDAGQSNQYDEFDIMAIEALTLALARLTCWRDKSNGTRALRAPKEYDPNVLRSLRGQGFVDFHDDDTDIKLTDDGYFFGDVFAASFISMLKDSASPFLDDERGIYPEERQPTMSNHAVSSKLHPAFSVLNGGHPDGPAGSTPTAAAGKSPNVPTPYFDTFFTPIEDRPQFNPLENRRANDRRSFRLRIELDLGDLHPCWREIEIPAVCTFLDLHIVIQRIFNWYDEHLFNFKMTTRGQKLHLEEAVFMDPTLDIFEPPQYAIAEAAAVRLGDVFPRTRTARYEYDYGDGWEHKVKVVKTTTNSSLTAPQLIDGEGDAPPEDVGGIGGLAEFLSIIADKDHPEHDDMASWAEYQMAYPFDLAEKQQELMESWDSDRERWLKAIANPR